MNSYTYIADFDNMFTFRPATCKIYNINYTSMYNVYLQYTYTLKVPLREIIITRHKHRHKVSN